MGQQSRTRSRSLPRTELSHIRNGFLLGRLAYLRTLIVSAGQDQFPKTNGEVVYEPAFPHKFFIAADRTGRFCAHVHSLNCEEIYARDAKQMIKSIQPRLNKLISSNCENSTARRACSSTRTKHIPELWSWTVGCWVFRFGA